MNKAFLGIIVLIILAGGWYWYAHEARPSAPAPASVPLLAADLYPLYMGATWGTVMAASTTNGSEVVSEPFTNVTNIAAISQPFTEYYRDRLTTAGWVPDASREAGGPGAETSYYRKGDAFAIVSYHSDFLVNHPDAPSECPCNVTLTLVSGTAEPSTP